MKNPVVYLVVVLVACLGLMVGLHGWEIQGLQQKGAQVEALSQRESIAGRMVLELEKYRRTSGSFRKLTNAEIDGVKTRLKSGILDGVSRLEKLGPTAEEVTLASRLNEQVNEFLVLSATLEPQLFLRDVFLKEPARELHDSMVSNAQLLQKSAERRRIAASRELTQSVPAQSRLLLLAAGIVLVMTSLILLRGYVAHSRPAKRLREKAVALGGPLASQVFSAQPVLRSLPGSTPKSSKNGAQNASASIGRGAYEETENVLTALAAGVESLRRERHRFVTAVAQDLRAPLVALQAGSKLLGEIDMASLEGTRSSAMSVDRRSAAEVMDRSLFRLSNSLHDLDDLVEIERSQIRLDEKIIDLRLIVREVAYRLGGPGATHDVHVTIPESPVWTLIDVERFERVLVHLVSKVMNFMPQGGRIEISMNRPSRGSFRGLEVVVQDGERVAHGRGAPTGPEQDLLSHWVSENGFGMALVDKVVRAHGGTVTASGVAGTGVLFTLRLPQERLGAGVVSTSQASSQSQQSPDASLTFTYAKDVESVYSKKNLGFGA